MSTERMKLKCLIPDDNECNDDENDDDNDDDDDDRDTEDGNDDNDENFDLKWLSYTRFSGPSSLYSGTAQGASGFRVTWIDRFLPEHNDKYGMCLHSCACVCCVCVCVRVCVCVCM